MKQLFIVSILIVQLFASCNSSSSSETTQVENSKDSINITNEEKEVSAALAPSNDSTSAVTSTNISVKTFEANSGFGYDIYTDGKLSIHQPSIPAVSGNSGFKNEADAKRTGDFIAYKISHGIMPPSVTPEELDSLGVINH